jgi:hypothetical protein
MNLSELPKIDEVWEILSDAQLLALMVSLYAHQGGQDPASELAFWERIFAS